MNIQAEKLGLIEWITQLNDLSIIEKIKHIHDEYSKSKDWYENISVADKDSIDRGLIDIANGKTHSHETAQKIYEKYL